MPAATTRYSGTSRFTVRPPEEIGTRKGSANTASIGSASRWRRMSTVSAPITTTATAA